MLTTIKLVRQHTHGGRKYPPGAQLTLAEHKAQWLIGLGVAEHATTDAAGKTKETK